MTVRDRVPSHLRGNPQNPPEEDHTTGLPKDQKRTLLPFITIGDTTNKLALVLVTTLPASTQREGGFCL